MLESELKSKIDKLWDLFWSGGIANPLTAIEQISYLLFMKRLDDKDIKGKKDAKFSGKKYQSIFRGNNELRWSHWKHFSAEEMLNHVRDKVFPFIKKLNSNGDNGFSAQMKDAVFIIPKPSLLVQAVEIIESLKIHEQNQDTQGDIYEYLLSELKTSGKNGQFRTPRHIIKMMCELVGIKVGQTVCDPACGTGGFLIGAYQHILKQYTSPKFITVDDEGSEHGLVGDKITSQKTWNYLKSKTFYGYDFDSTMLRISAMNMALHGIKNPNIKYLDSISKNNKEENLYDVILANPPFKGNIDKNDIHEMLSRTVKTTRTELLFIAQMMRLLKVGGQCAVIVPNGVLFRSDKAHTAIRTKIIESAQLSAVISMPSGVFKPYAGVSTAILLFTKGGETDRVWFYDMTADGFSLDDKRDKIEENDIPDIIEKWKNRNKLKTPTEKEKWFFVDKKKILESEDYSLNGRIYKETVSYTQTKWPIVELGEILTLEYGKGLKKSERKGELYPVFGSNGIDGYHSEYLIKAPLIIVGRKGSAGKVNYYEQNGFPIDTTFYVKLKKSYSINLKYLFFQLKKSSLNKLSSQSAVPGINRNHVYSIKIPLPPLETQKEIVTEVEGYQKIIDGAKQVVENWKPSFKINSSWPIVNIDKILSLEYGKSLKKSDRNEGDYPVFGSNGIDGYHNKYLVKAPLIVIGRKGSAGKVNYYEQNGFPIDTTFYIKLKKSNLVNLRYLFFQLKELNLNKFSSQSAVPGINRNHIYSIKVPLPKIEIQEEIVAEIEKEKSHIESCKELIKINTEKIQQKIKEI